MESATYQCPYAECSQSFRYPARLHGDVQCPYCDRAINITGRRVAPIEVDLDVTSPTATRSLAASILSSLFLLTVAWVVVGGAVANPENHLNIHIDETLIGWLFYASYLVVPIVAVLVHRAGHSGIIGSYGVSSGVMNSRLSEFRRSLGTEIGAFRHFWAWLNVIAWTVMLISIASLPRFLAGPQFFVPFIGLPLNAARLFFTRLSLLRGALGLLAVLWIPATVIVAAQVAIDIAMSMSPSGREQLGDMPDYALPLSAALVLISALGAWRYGARLASARNMSARQARRTDRRAPILFLRSFQDDYQNLYQNTPFEKTIADEVRRYGPVIAIGQPGVLPDGGAARDFYTGDNWQDAIKAWMEAALAIVVIAGETPGLAWEINAAVNKGHSDKLVILFPPNATRIQSRWDQISAMLKNTSAGAALAQAPANRALAVAQDRNGDVFVHRGTRRDPHQFMLALRCALYARFCR